MRIFIPIGDEPTFDVEDVLGRKIMIHEVARSILAADAPQVFGIHGDWGAGKTSVLQELQGALSGECPQNPKAKPKALTVEFKNNLTVVWFEAWRYQHETSPIVALLHEIRAQITWSAHFRKKLGESINKTAEVAIRGSLMSLENLTKKIGFQASKIQEAGERFERENLATTLPSHQIRDLLDDAISNLIGRKPKDLKKKLVIIIDDLDRCEPDCAYRLLEGIKIYLNLPSCIFVLGLNQREVEWAIAKSISKAPGADDHEQREVMMVRAQEYLEKLCGNIWRIPMPTANQRAELVKRWLVDRTIPENMAETIRSLVEAYECLPANPQKNQGVLQHPRPAFDRRTPNGRARRN